MKNIIAFDVTNDCVCTCVNNIADNTNRLLVEYTGVGKNGQLNIFVDGTLKATLPVVDNVKVEVDSKYYSTACTLSLQYKDSVKTGARFNINVQAEPTSHTGIRVKQIDSMTFELVYIIPTATGGGGASITVDSALSTTSTNPVENRVITTKLNGLESNMSEVFQSVSNGKKLVATAITDKGVPTENDATFKTMADNINTINNVGRGSQVALTRFITNDSRETIRYSLHTILNDTGVLCECSSSIVSEE